jgi:hypothetical protein
MADNSERSDVDDFANVVPHPKRGIMTEVKIEREIMDSPEAKALQEEIFKAVTAYWHFLNDHGLIWQEIGDDRPRLKAEAVVVTCGYLEDGAEACEIKLKDGAIDRVFGDGVNPDPDGRDADPPRPPRSPRRRDPW